MKKKTKLFATVASLCLAVALMAFGVYAATTSSLAVTSKVTFTSANLHIKYTVDVAYDTAYATCTGAATPTTAYGDTHKSNTWEKEFSGNEEQNGADQSWVLGTYEFTSAARKDNKIIYTITIQNLGVQEVAITLDAEKSLPTPNTEATAAVNVTVADDADKTLSTNEEMVVTITYTMNDITRDYNATDDGVIDLTYHAARG